VKSLPAILKGADMAVYSVFHALGLAMTVLPVLALDDQFRPGYFERAGADRSVSYVGSELRPLSITELEAPRWILTRMSWKHSGEPGWTYGG
jgi:hypothetical protein